MHHNNNDRATTTTALATPDRPGREGGREGQRPIGDRVVRPGHQDGRKVSPMERTGRYCCLRVKQRYNPPSVKDTHWYFGVLGTPLHVVHSAGHHAYEKMVILNRGRCVYIRRP